jgi:F-type H+-transporting ATPase subunit b
MLIDWFTVAAQIINFLILILLLRHFLYRPVIRAMAEREAKIAAQLDEASALKQQAVEEAESYRQQRKELDHRRDAFLSQAREDADVWRKDSIRKAREEIAEARTSWHKSIAVEKQAFMQELRHRIGSQICTISRSALADLADVELEQQMIAVFLQQLKTLDDTERALLRQSIDHHVSELVVRSAFHMTPDTRQLVLDHIHTDIAADLVIRFETVPDLLCGIEIRSQDYKLAWTLHNYLMSLEENLFEVFDEKLEQEQYVQ